jgi:hypothetical protein
MHGGRFMVVSVLPLRFSSVLRYSGLTFSVLSLLITLLGLGSIIVIPPIFFPAISIPVVNET